MIILIGALGDNMNDRYSAAQKVWDTLNTEEREAALRAAGYLPKMVSGNESPEIIYVAVKHLLNNN